MSNHYLIPNWPAPTTIKAYCSTRQGGFSKDLFASFNLADQVGDEPEHVKQNRDLLYQELNITQPINWLEQVHGNYVVTIDNCSERPRADACYTTKPTYVCAVLTADCLPILLCDKAGTQVAAIHSSWRSLLAGVIDNTVEKFTCPQNEIIAWLGPAIGPKVFGLNETIYLDFIARNAENSAGFHQQKGQWFMDIYHLARISLNNVGVNEIYGGGYCTFEDSERFFSYRRNETTGRMASVIWLNPE